MIEIIVAFIVYWFLIDPEQEEYNNSNDEVIRPILMDNFDNNDGDFGD